MKKEKTQSTNSPDKEQPSVADILKSIRHIINEQNAPIGTSGNQEDILELTQVINEHTETPCPQDIQRNAVQEIRPVVVNWLNHNLPELVEQVVEREMKKRSDIYDKH